MLDSVVLRKAADTLEISLPAACKRRHRFSEWLSYAETNHMEGIVEMDASCLKVAKKRKKLNRAAHHRGEKAKQRGL